MTGCKAFPSAVAAMTRTVYVSQFTQTSNDGAQLLQTPADEGRAIVRIAAACRNQLQGRLADEAQDGPANGFDQLLRSTDRICGAIVCKQLQPPAAVIDPCQVLDTGHRERARSRLSRPEDALREEEAVTLGPPYEKLDLRRGDLVDQRPERIAEPIQLSRIVLVHAGDVTAESGSARPAGLAGVLARTNARAFECPIDLTKRN